MENVGLMAALAGAMTKAPSTAQGTAAVDDWLEDHPEATTTVQDGAITKAKLNASLQGTVDDVSKLNDASRYHVETLSGSDIYQGYWYTSDPPHMNFASTTRISPRELIILSPGDKLTFATSVLQLGVWVKKESENSYTNVFPYGLTTGTETLQYDETATIVIQMKKSDGSNITPANYDAEIKVWRVKSDANETDVNRINSTSIDIETLESSDFVSGTYTLITDEKGSSSARICTKYIRSAKAGDVLLYSSSVHQIGVWVVYAGDVEATNIIPYGFFYTTNKFTFPKDVLELLVQCKYDDNANISPSNYNASISIVKSKAVTGTIGNRVARNECIKSVNHRGYQNDAPENTLAAFKLSAKHGFAWIETDVQFTSDDVPVILHDRSINRTARNANGTAISGTVNIDSITYEQALGYDFGVWFSSEFAGTKIPSFEQMINLCKNIGLKVRIELKSETVTTSKIATLVNIVKKYGMVKNVEWASFSDTLLAKIATDYPTFDIGYIVSTITDATVTTAQSLKTATNNVTVAASYSNTRDAVNKLIAADLPMDVWTITNIDQIINGNPYMSSITTNRYMASEVLYEY